MKHLNYLLAAFVLFAFTSSCKKLADVEPDRAPSKSTSTTSTTSTTSIKIIDTDTFIHSISFNAQRQYVNISVSGSQLTMVYNEDVNIFIPKQGYDLTYAIHLTEDFANSTLSKFHFTTTDAEGNIFYDWDDDNLNGIPSKTVSDTTMSGFAMVKINIKRPFTFTAIYDNNAAAVNAENSMLMLKADEIEFSSYVFFTKTYPATDAIAPITYLKAD
jgi:hypothetical protein